MCVGYSDGRFGNNVGVRMVHMGFIEVELAPQFFVGNDNLCVMQASHIKRFGQGRHSNNVIRIGTASYC